MFVSGFTIARNVVKADYPLKEAVESVLPICDEFVIAVGKSDDSTLEFVRSFNSPKIKIIETVWDDNLREGGRVLAIETDKALMAVSPKADWCFYVQADECLHEQYLETVMEAMIDYLDDRSVDGLLFNYKHFYGSYDYLADSRNWYRKEIRVIRNDASIRSYRDAQGFRKNDRKLKVKAIDAYMFHYGWVKHPKQQLEKLKQARKLWHSDEFIEKSYANINEYDFSIVDSLSRYQGSHPEVMKARINAKNWEFEYDISIKKMSFKKRILHFIERLTGWRVGENKNYIEI
ncbi:MAG: glycosyltransferase family 2 protein [Bacteroidia bacterium]|nr:glycosyltransferase family 2 protein [Bacteroidia bacterium]